MKQRRVGCWIAALALAAVAAGCSHQYELRAGDEVEPVDLPGLADKRVAVVFRQPQFAPRFEGSADGHKFTFVHLDRYFEGWFRKAFGGSFAQLDFFRGQGEGGYDAYLYPSLAMDMGGGMRKSCSARVGMAVMDSGGRTVYDGTTDGEHSFGVIAAADEACKVAFYKAAEGSVSEALGELTAVPSASARESTAGGAAPVESPAGQAEPAAAGARPAPTETGSGSPARAPAAGAGEDGPAPARGQSEGRGDGGSGQCVPPCRSGHLCHEGRCVSACNPPCPQGERCTPQGRCVPAGR
ncbi:MAG: hypothetical protein ACODAU_06025 [Myxococcota bacterium]